MYLMLLSTATTPIVINLSSVTNSLSNVFFSGHKKSGYGKSFGRYGNDRPFSQRSGQFRRSNYSSNFERENNYDNNRNYNVFRQNASRFTKMDDDL